MNVKSVYENQQDILQGIITLHVPSGFECDVTYGNGSFYKGLIPPLLKFDLDPQISGVIAACSTALPLRDSSLGSMVFDPPFLTYVKAAREHKSIMARRFGGYWASAELETHYRGTLKEAGRVLKRGGILVFKCQDIIHNHKMLCTHANVMQWASENHLRLKDLFILPAKYRMPMPTKNATQKHARIHHGYFLVFERL